MNSISFNRRFNMSIISIFAHENKRRQSRMMGHAYESMKINPRVELHKLVYGDYKDQYRAEIDAIKDGFRDALGMEVREVWDSMNGTIYILTDGSYWVLATAGARTKTQLHCIVAPARHRRVPDMGYCAIMNHARDQGAASLMFVPTARYGISNEQRHLNHLMELSQKAFEEGGWVIEHIQPILKGSNTATGVKTYSGIDVAASKDGVDHLYSWTFGEYGFFEEIA